MHPIEMEVLVAMRHEELHRLRRSSGRRRPIDEPLDPVGVAHRVCGRFVPATLPPKARCV
ncbi:MAG TPA: hypothetical protein VI316_03650 [Candidatus Dormibacteraeota bacterium]